MSRNTALSVFLAFALGVSACSSDAPGSTATVPSFPIERLTNAAILEVISLDPEPAQPGADSTALAVKDGPAFHGWPYLDRSTSVSKADQSILLDQLGTMFADPPDATSACYLPRHALRLQTEGGDLDVLVCFECGNYEIYDGAGRQLVFSPFRGADEAMWYAIFERSGVLRQLHSARTPGA